MGHTWLPPAARRLGVGVLAAGLVAAMAPAGQVVASTVIDRPVPAQLNPAAARARAALAGRTAAQTGLISGQVRSVGGSPAGGACLTALGHGSHASARTGPDGRYLLGGLRPGQYHITVSPCATQSAHPAISAYWTSGPASVTVHAGQISNPAPLSTWHLDLTSLAAAARQPLPATASRGSISGRVTGNGRPLRGVCAVAEPLRRGSPEIARTGKAGKYRIGRLRPGRYAVLFVAGFTQCPNKGNWLDQWYPGVNSLIPTGKVKLLRVRAGKDIGGIDGHLKKGGEISGTVRAKSGKALPGICADVMATFPLQGGILIVDIPSPTNKAGQYAARGLFPAGYQVQFSIGCGTKGNFAEQWWRNTPLQSRARTIRIKGIRQVTNVNATLLPGATVAGVVKALNAKGKPLARVCVVVIQSDGNILNIIQTGSDGRYRLIGLPPGPLQIQFDPTCETGSSQFLVAQRDIRLTVGQTLTGFNVFLQKGGGISGVVTDAHGQPLGGVCVLVNDFNGDFTRTRPNGHYSLIGVVNGSFQIEFSGGCGNAGSVAPQFYPNSPTSLLAKPIRFRQDTVTTNINATMQPGGTLTGLVTDTAGHPLPGICISVLTGSPAQIGFAVAGDGVSQGANAITPGGNATAAVGKYRFANLEPGAYGLSFGCGGYGQEFFPTQVNASTAGLISVNAGTTRVPVTRLSRAGTITGTVTSKAGKPQPGVCVQVAPVASENPFDPVGFGFTNPQGRYSIGGLAAARYLVQFTNCAPKRTLAPQWYRRTPREAVATPVKVSPGRTDAGVNAVMTSGGTITGRVLGPTGKPASAICVTASSQQAQATLGSQTGRSGRYRVAGLSTGRWSLTFTPCDSPNPDLGSVTRPGTVRITAPRTVKGVNVRLPLGGSVSGRVTSRADGEPISNVCVELMPVRANGNFGVAFTDGKGRYIASQLAPGRYRAFIADPGCDGFPDDVQPVAPQWYKGQPTRATAKTVHVTADATTTGIDSALTPFGAVTGTAETDGHAPVSGECVTAVPFGTPPDPLFGAPAQQEVAITNGTGGYTLTTLMPGRYKIEFSSGCGGSRFATQWWDNARSATSAKVITVKFATISGINATLRK